MSSLQQKPLPILSDMPWNIKRQIVETADFRTRISLRLSSKEYLHHVDKSPTVYDRLIITVRAYSVQFAIHDSAGDKIISKTYMDKGEKDDADEERLQKLVKHPRTRIGNLDLNFASNSTVFAKKTIEALREREGDLLVNKISFTMDMTSRLFPCIHRIVSCLQSGFLEAICLTNSARVGQISLKALAATDQWKQAKKLYVDRFKMVLEYEKWKHLEFGTLPIENLSVKAIKGIMERFFLSSSWMEFKVDYDETSFETVRDYFRERAGSQNGLISYDLPNYFVCLIPNPFKLWEQIPVRVSTTFFDAVRN